MPNNILAPDFKQSIDSHEDRLQRLENKLQDVAIKIAETDVKLDYVSAQLEQSRHELADKLDEGFAATSKRDEKVFEKLEAQENRIQPLEAAFAKSKQRKDFWIKMTVGALLAAAGFVATKATEWIWGLANNG